MKKDTWNNPKFVPKSGIKFALDTNVLVFASDPTNPHFDFCENLLNEAETGDKVFCIADKNLYELYAVLENLAVKKGIGTIQQAQQTLEMYLNCGYFEILHSTNQTALIVNELVKQKQKLKKAYIHDIVLVAMLIENDVEFLYTDNKKDFEEFQQIKVLPLA